MKPTPFTSETAKARATCFAHRATGLNSKTQFRPRLVYIILKSWNLKTRHTNTHDTDAD